jgi:glycosyltransferase involved in cell wall biosynthesis
MPPLISCVMATANRPGFVRQALRCFVRQTYPNKELVVVDDGDRPVRALCRNLPGVRYLRPLQPATLGAKLNLGVESARGSIIQKIDDDDFYHADFLATSAANLPVRDRETTLVARCCFLVLLRGDPLLRHSGHGWKAGGTFCFDRAMWRKSPFRDVPRSVDSWFLRDHEPEIGRICRTEEYILVRHGCNTWKSMTTGDADDYFRARPVYEKALRQVVPSEDLHFYRSLVLESRPPGLPSLT